MIGQNASTDPAEQFAQTIKDQARRIADLERAAGRAPATTGVDSVNGHTGVVVIDSDDISDTGNTHRFTTAADIAKLASLHAAYVHTQGVASATWTVVHGFNKPNVIPTFTVIDAGGLQVEPEPTYIDANTLQLNFLWLVDGKAYLP